MVLKEILTKEKQKWNNMLNALESYKNYYNNNCSIISMCSLCKNNIKYLEDKINNL